MELEKKQRIDNIWKERTKKVKVEIDDSLKQKEFEICTTQIENCLSLLIPSVDNFLFHDPASDKKGASGKDSHEDGNRENGMISRKLDISVVLSSDKELFSEEMIVKNDDNICVLENLKDQFTILQNRLLPKVKKWSITLTKAGIQESTELLKKVIDIKQELEYLENKVSSLDLFKHDKNHLELRKNDSDTDESDFEEVPDKEGYEEHANINHQHEVDNHFKDEKCTLLGSSGSSNPSR